jgi:hypothetical protein
LAIIGGGGPVNLVSLGGFSIVCHIPEPTPGGLYAPHRPRVEAGASWTTGRIHKMRKFTMNRQTCVPGLHPSAPSIAMKIAIAAMLALGGCAPDAIRNYAATGFNGYLDSLKTACPNLQIGPNEIGLWLQYSSVNDNFNYWLDMTSKLYYRRISAGEYRSAVAAQLGDGSANAGSFDCIIRNLPEQRDTAPPPSKTIMY